jgi:formylglycine-generating enzyme required for sulfatase activity
VRKTIQGLSKDHIPNLVKEGHLTPDQAEFLTWIRYMSDEEFEQWLEEEYSSAKIYRAPEFWNDARFNNKSQPVVGVTWFEARAYCNWLTANASPNSERIFRLPTEAEFEAAARGKEGRKYPYGNDFGENRCNTFEVHIRRTTPVGVFDNATPEGAFDLAGNAWTWTSSIYDQDNFPYEYKGDDGREDIYRKDANRILRGGSWIGSQDDARAVYRGILVPNVRDSGVGFRVVLGLRPPSQKGFSDH